MAPRFIACTLIGTVPWPERKTIDGIVATASELRLQVEAREARHPNV